MLPSVAEKEKKDMAERVIKAALLGFGTVGGAAKKVLGNPKATKDEVATALNAVNKAKEELKVKEADKKDEEPKKEEPKKDPTNENINNGSTNGLTGSAVASSSCNAVSVIGSASGVSRIASTAVSAGSGSFPSVPSASWKISMNSFPVIVSRSIRNAAILSSVFLCSQSICFACS